MTAFSGLLDEMDRNGWVCLQPTLWTELWEMLPERRRAGRGWEPPLPLILAAWWETTDEQKHERFLDHLHWAEAHGAADRVTGFLSSLEETAWHKRGD